MSYKMKTAAVALSVPFLLAGCTQYDDGLTRGERLKLWEEQKQQEIISALEAFNVSEIEMPKALYDLKKGAYDITVKRNGEEQNCVANVLETTHGRKNVILTNCR